MSKMSKELRFWATDDIVPADLQHLCNRAADSHEALLAACELQLADRTAKQHMSFHTLEKMTTAVATAKKT